jgi:hypothetical protein
MSIAPREGSDSPELPVVRNDIGMVEQDDWSFASVSLQPGPDGGAAWNRLEELILNALALADAGEEFRRANLITRRVGRVYLEILNEEVEGFLLNLVPIDIVIGRAGDARRDINEDSQTKQNAQQEVALKWHVASGDMYCSRSTPESDFNRLVGYSRIAPPPSVCI